MNLKEIKKTKAGRKIVQSEFRAQICLCRWLKINNILFQCNLFDRLNVKKASMYKDLNAVGMPDLFICQSVGGYSGLFIELKKEGTKLYKKNMDWASEHIKNQAKRIDELRARGYQAVFAVGFNEALKIIINYLNNK